MRIITAAQVEAALDYPLLIERLRQAFRSGGEVPMRLHYEIPTYSEHSGNLLIMPAWQQGRHVGVKLVTVYPDNGRQNLPAVIGSYMLMDAKTGQPKALIDGSMLTVKRTACASALASGYLSRNDASRLLVVGTGALAPHLALAHMAVRPVSEILIWGRNAEKAAKLAKALSRHVRRNQSVRATADLEAAARGADIITCATLSNEPLIHGEWLAEGAHLDLVGGFKPTMREADDEAIRRARVFVDTYQGALKEAGDITQPVKAGVLAEDDIAGDLFQLARGERSGRRFYDQITVFKSVGTALEDLAAAELAFERS